MSFIKTDKRHPIMWRKKMITNQIKANKFSIGLYVPHSKTSIAVAKKASIDKRLFVQFITAVRQIEASSRVAEDNVNHFEVG